MSDTSAERYLDRCSEYTAPYEREKLVRDWERKDAMADAVVEDFRKRAGDPRGKNILEVGFGGGAYVSAFTRAGGEVHGLEINPVLLQLAQERMHARSLTADLRVYDGHTSPFPDNFFDYAYSISVLEHVSDARRMLAETVRTLRQGGALYLAFPNRWALRETHTGYFFVGYLPRAWAGRVLRLLGSNAVEELNLHFLSYTALTRLLKGLPVHIRMEYGGATKIRRMIKRKLGILGLHWSSILSTVMVVIEKNG